MYRILIESPLLGPTAEVVRLDGSEALGELFEYRVTVALDSPAALRGREAEVLESRFTLLFEDDGRIVSHVQAIAREARIRVSANQDTGALELWLVPRAWTLTLGSSSQIFLDRTIPEIVSEKLESAGFQQGADYMMVLRGRYPGREFTVQYRESDFAFIARLCEHAGITLFFKHDGERDRIVFTDGGDAYEQAAVDGGLVRYDTRDDKRAAMEVAQTFRRVPERVVVHDYNYRSPNVSLSAASRTAGPVAHGAVISYGDHTKSPDEIGALARIRAEETAARHHVVEARTRQLALRAGHVFSLEGPDDTEQRLLITRLVVRSHEVNAAGHPDAKAWHNEVTAIPASTPFRPPRNTPKPRIEGLIHAAIDGAIRGPYAEIDEQGRYRVRFNYDLAGRPGLHATHSIRMMQPHAGARYGMHFPLRAGTEVLIGFVEGDPDRPVIVGSIPNPITPSPVEQANFTHNVLRSQSGDEIVMDDAVDHERIRIHTPKEETTLQLGEVEEPELGALLVTDANITEAAGDSINESTARKTTIAATSAEVVGDTAILVAGLPAVGRAAVTGMQDLGAVSAQEQAMRAELERLGLPAGEFAVADEERKPGGEGGAASAGAVGLWSDLGASVASAARDACLQAVRSAAVAADTNRLDGKGRRQGEPVGEPGAPAVVLASPETAALIGRSRTVVYGERVAALAAHDTATVVAGATVEVKSPGTVEIAGSDETLVTSAGTLDLASKRLRMVAGYYPEKEAPDLDDGTSVGVMGRRDIRLTSIEHCIHVCAHKDLNAAAHAGNMRMKAQKAVSIQGGTVSVSGGGVNVNSNRDVVIKAGSCLSAEAAADVAILAGACVSIEGATVVITGGSITLKGRVLVDGDLTVSGSLNGG